jgi:Lrp/AsnC family transcriptional regulator, regulator for asnA, asnC and gidA
MQIDEIDTRILSDLEKDSRTPFLRIAKELKVSEGTIRKRVSKLVESGTIKRFTIELKYNYTAIVGVETNPHIPTKDIVQEMKTLEIKKIYEVAGRYDLICYIAKKNLEDINEVLERMRIVKGVEHTETFTILKDNF